MDILQLAREQGTCWKNDLEQCEYDTGRTPVLWTSVIVVVRIVRDRW